MKLRLQEHNAINGKRYSKKYSPWKLQTYLAFSNSKEAKKFEKYLKSSSGNAFLKKRLISNSFKVALTKFNNARKMVSETKWSLPARRATQDLFLQSKNLVAWGTFYQR